MKTLTKTDLNNGTVILTWNDSGRNCAGDKVNGLIEHLLIFENRLENIEGEK